MWNYASMWYYVNRIICPPSYPTSISKLEVKVPHSQWNLLGLVRLSNHLRIFDAEFRLFCIFDWNCSKHKPIEPNDKTREKQSTPQMHASMPSSSSFHHFMYSFFYYFNLHYHYSLSLLFIILWSFHYFISSFGQFIISLTRLFYCKKSSRHTVKKTKEKTFY